MGGLSLFSLAFPTAIVYMLQSTEYQVAPYLRWFWRTSDFRQVMKRRTLERTKAARLLLWTVRLGIVLQLITGGVLIWLGVALDVAGAWQLGTGLVVAYPVIWAHLIVLPIVLGDVLVVRPRSRRMISQSKAIFANFKGVKIAVAGSYGKTTMKELLGTILSEGKKVAITPANKNVATSHALFALGLTGDEEVLVIELGEGQPGDVMQFANTIQPNIGIITGIAPAHLDQYPSLDAAARDIFSVADYLDNKQVYVNDESPLARPYIKKSHITYSAVQVAGWHIKDIQVSYDGTRFTMNKGNRKLHLKSGLLGRHQVGPLAVSAAIADALGMTPQQIEAGVSRTESFEHRMQPRQLRGAWIIDDTYNGNIDGIRAGLELLVELPAKRKIYVTPGLVDQGVETEKVHLEIGELIAHAKPDQVVLMQNSATTYIQHGMDRSGYVGDVRIVDDPLEYYTHLEHFIAAGDLVVMQNDWTDNYY